jgi:hypothetical protein
MAANTAPIYSAKGDIQWGAQWGQAALTTGNPSYEGTGSGVVIVCSASIEGNFIQRLRFKASGSTTGSVARIFINNGSSTGSRENNFLYDEVTLPAVTATSGSATTTIEIPMNFVLPASYRITATIGINQTVGGWYVGAVGGSYQQ